VGLQPQLRDPAGTMNILFFENANFTAGVFGRARVLSRSKFHDFRGATPVFVGATRDKWNQHQTLGEMVGSWVVWPLSGGLRFIYVVILGTEF